jgi:hypothetical protein
MSNLILPPGLEPPPPLEETGIPEAIHDSFQLLIYGIENQTLALMRKKMDDSSTEVIYDLSVGIMHPLTRELRHYPIARMLPQHEKEAGNNEPSVTTVPPSNPIN